MMSDHTTPGDDTGERPRPLTRADFSGPRTGPLPVVGVLATGELPYASGRRRRRWIPMVAVVGALGLVAVGVVLLQQDRGTSTARRAAPTTVTPAAARTAASPATGRATTAPPPTAAPTTAPPTTAPPTTAAPAGPIPLSHRAVYRDGKLYLEGAVHDGATGHELYQKAVAVVGEDNVVGGYLIDPRIPPGTDGKVIVDQRFVFPTGSAQLDPSYSNVLELGVIVMTQNPQVTMIIDGYTDSTGDPNSNLLLSQARASAVVSYFASRGIDPGRFVPIGHGSADPVASNDTEEGRAQNRRIEVTLEHLIS